MSARLDLTGVGSDAGVEGGRIVAYRNNYVFMGGRGPDGDGLIVWDVTNRSAPVKVAQISGGLVFGRGVALNGNVAYVTGRDNGGLASFDVTDPTNPTHLDSHIDTAQRGARGIVVDGHYAHVLCGILNGTGTTGIATYDITDPSNLTLVSRITSANNPNILSSGFGLLDSERRLLFAGDYNNTSGPGDNIMVYDVANPEAITLRSRLVSANLNGVRGLERAGDILLAASEGMASVVAIDISNPDDLQQVGVLTDPILDGARGLSRIGNILFLSARVTARIVAIDISVAASPTIITYLTTPSLDNVYGNANDGKYIFGPSTSSGNLTIVEWIAAIPISSGVYVVAGNSLETAQVNVVSDGVLKPSSLG